MLKGAIFDLDGTLLDSMFIWNTMGELYLRTLGIEPRENLRETFKTFSLYEAACYFQNVYDVGYSADEIMNSINKMVEGYYRETVLLKPGVKDFLERNRANGIKMCIATATDTYLAEAALSRLGISKYFSEIFTCTAVGCSKKKPDIYRRARAHLGTKKEETAVFEDAVYAIKTAKADGFITVAVHDKYEQEQVVLKELSDFYIVNFAEWNAFWEFASAF